MATWREVLATAEAAAESAKASARQARGEAEDARERKTHLPGTASPDDVRRAQREVRAAEETVRTAEAAATRAGQHLAVMRFEAALDDWVWRYEDGQPVSLDTGLSALSQGDVYLLAALHLRRDGVTVPAGWRSPDGHTL